MASEGLPMRPKPCRSSDYLERGVPLWLHRQAPKELAFTRGPMRRPNGVSFAIKTEK